ncbi:hypothetical protein [uncultured Tenacibaculum sp.]|uniref:hypothetical protein n=1 Tax=uncultured Tenacibaculum sp. TaxID=174713 RepID=UPI00262B091D|nr:hypothetical protein [uncultured Tenacibaculum sp.]
MKDYSLENSIELINSEKTKEYFREVTSSYFNGNYRASIVTLYSVVINDILIKLEVLDEIYSDTIAKDILNEIRTFQQANTNSPDWEKDIIEKVKNRTSLIDNVDYAHILALKNDRHLCAHPVLDKDDKLYTPNKETVASHIRNMLESLFLKPPILSKKILSTILVDIANKKELLIDDESLEKYIKAKYLNNLNPTVEVSIFRDLWKFIYRIDNQDVEENRLINYRVLYFLYKRNTSLCIQKIKSEQEYFSNVRNSEHTINFLIRFLSENEFLYSEFREDIHLLITKHIEKDISAKTVAWFLSESFLKHLKQVKEWISGNYNQTIPFDASVFAYQRLLKVGLAKGYIKEVTEFIIWRYSEAKNYSDADKVFAYIVRPYLDKFTEEQITELCKKANRNSQVYGRKRADEDHKELRKYIEININEAFEFSKYNNVFE